LKQIFSFDKTYNVQKKKKKEMECVSNSKLKGFVALSANIRFALVYHFFEQPPRGSTGLNLLAVAPGFIFKKIKKIVVFFYGII